MIISILLQTLKSIKIVLFAVIAKNLCVENWYSKQYKAYFCDDAINNFLNDIINKVLMALK